MNYLCDEHFESLAGTYGEWFHHVVSQAKCIVCGRDAIYRVVSLTLKEDDLASYIICINNEARRNHIITKEEIEEGTEAWIHENNCEHYCGQCHFPLTLVRPGKYQCETPWCPSNQKEETK